MSEKQGEALYQDLLGVFSRNLEGEQRMMGDWAVKFAQSKGTDQDAYIAYRVAKARMEIWDQAQSSITSRGGFIRRLVDPQEVK